ncbi:MAG TPA: hypothetical protein VNT60_10295, partial [Deinococcales bacterium]|nr:hypothetical protein [Deinococcales bacterium]
MIVYGDPSFYVQAGALARHLLTVESSRPGADDLRYLLIAAGQLEQAVADEPALAGHCQAAERATDGAARAFLAAAGSGDPAPKLAESTAALESLVGVTAPVRVKQPEGYAFYALYPEQYLAATDEWLREGAPEPGSLVLVVGVRSIGTSLSALVAAALERSGLRTRRCTVRPAGHPYERRVSLPRRVAEGAAYGIAVDEGPGQSGSSLAATVAALSEAGLAWERIALLPGHAGKPGEAASPEVREVWGRVARYSVPLGDLSWGGRALTAELAGATEAACGAPCTGVEDLGWGAWRELAYPGREWPPAALPFERPKYLVSLGDGRRALWKFAGLGTGPGLVPTAEAARRRLHRLAALGWTVEAAGMHLGFVAVPWVEGARPGREDREAARAAGRYVAAACGEELAAPEIEAGFERLAEMLY